MANRGLARGTYGRSIKLAYKQVCGVVLAQSEELIPVPFEDPFSKIQSLVYMNGSDRQRARLRLLSSTSRRFLGTLVSAIRMDMDGYLPDADESRVNSAQDPTYTPPVERPRDKIVRETVKLLQDEELKLLNGEQRRLLKVRKLSYPCIAKVPSGTDPKERATRVAGVLKAVLMTRKYDPDGPKGPQAVTPEEMLAEVKDSEDFRSRLDISIYNSGSGLAGEAKTTQGTKRSTCGDEDELDLTGQLSSLSMRTSMEDGQGGASPKKSRK
ncbi:hypothetical protein HD553DRAFT_21327 [Filobasidium floriforme]|uniref:uncharacterized protein n=1 Tax=Filobasidium floriforme TaxID=5210 RepID=UPI001E8E933B|nr:uncharacterized protein HD553DRAFT_21327 [Filobasidium floriforme]KAH8090949.1 hypothetical protein HD553DRAFT_21327 [Filobasidium floriforme]